MGYVTFNVRDKGMRFSLARPRIDAAQFLAIVFLIYIVIDIQFIIYTVFTLSYLDAAFFTTVILSIPCPVVFVFTHFIAKKRGLTAFEYLNHVVNLRSF